MNYKKILKGYVAGKLNSGATGYIQNMHRMIKTAKTLREHGYSVYVPCNDFLEGIVDGNFTYKDFFDNSQPWLLSSDFIFLTPKWRGSKGTVYEIHLANENNIPIFEDINELNKWRDGR